MFETPDFSTMDRKQLEKELVRWTGQHRITGDELSRFERASSIAREEGTSPTLYVIGRLGELHAESRHQKRQITLINERLAKVS